MNHRVTRIWCTNICILVYKYLHCIIDYIIDCIVDIRDNEIGKLQKILCKLVESHSILKQENEELKRRLQSYNNRIIM